FTLITHIHSIHRVTNRVITITLLHEERTLTQSYNRTSNRQLLVGKVIEPQPHVVSLLYSKRRLVLILNVDRNSGVDDSRIDHTQRTQIIVYLVVNILYQCLPARRHCYRSSRYIEAKLIVATHRR